MKDFIIIWILMMIGAGIALISFYPYNKTTWDNGVKEGRCIEQGGTLHNVDGELKCLFNEK